MTAQNGQLPGSLELAFLGDTIYDLYVRTLLVKKGGKIKQMHAEAVKHVCASAQSDAFTRIEAMLCEEERAVARRARNARQTPTKNADSADYHRATALEALIGYLFITGQSARMEQIIRAALSSFEETAPDSPRREEDPPCRK